MATLHATVKKSRKLPPGMNRWITEFRKRYTWFRLFTFAFLPECHRFIKIIFYRIKVSAYGRKTCYMAAFIPLQQNTPGLHGIQFRQIIRRWNQAALFFADILRPNRPGRPPWFVIRIKRA